VFIQETLSPWAVRDNQLSAAMLLSSSKVGGKVVLDSATFGFPLFHVGLMAQLVTLGWLSIVTVHPRLNPSLVYDGVGGSRVPVDHWQRIHPHRPLR
jgi:hypothetical protein